MDHQQADVDAVEHRPGNEPHRGSILLVEDDEVLAGSLARYLVARGHRVAVAGSAEAAVAELRGGLRPGLIVLDINLPEATGWDVLRGAAYRDAGAPPVLIVSATAVPAGRLAELGVAGHLPKPFPLPTFIAAVERHIRPEAPGASVLEGDPS